ncbi:ABC transporter substrate-binding protein [Megasphaera cerevisiae DSM 20462]|jgi:L-cystine transport system substrate-binding protein|uniref:ABC transporter substrate-binding protein n=1 Tax=Megasphaera cerevisiae DSM 20462 TaxID=1122219 RepID=A0A0J6WXI6_9FIRM|nr:transporter substrate-binding domain-containing protein [Megasphaera cerevisiae]KMO86943.1 ABC transporter substrate-binding protein [Megasphaera cerevisiae DSM 20462]OKY54104.1 ABC transporter substrate-binding protein [Megasphaera cerevisiae]SJZ55854.1 L-cystine transport system substrate-binding protein [Megasphaera cerevisiae DSM 20462]
MKIYNYVSRIIVAVAVSSVMAVAAGCGDVGTVKQEDRNTIVVATRGTSKPFSYTDDNGRLTGYDVEVLKEIERRDPSLKFEFKPMAVDAAFVAMDSGQVDMIANQMRHSEARDKKYIFPKELNNYTARRLVVKKGRADIQSLEDLKGKKVAVTTNSEFNDLIKKFNETAEPKVDVIYTDKASAETLNLVATGRADAAGEYEYLVKSFQTDKNLPVETVGPILQDVPTYFLLRKDSKMQQVADKIDKALQAMKKDGTLKQLSEKYLGGDYTVKPEN